jgi:hypothetical protein
VLMLMLLVVLRMNENVQNEQEKKRLTTSMWVHIAPSMAYNSHKDRHIQSIRVLQKVSRMTSLYKTKENKR